MSVVSDLFAGGLTGVLGGIGNLATGLRAAITGKSVLTGEEQTQLLMQAAQLEAAAKQAEALANSAQVDLDKIEAASTSLFKSGWRPAVGWTCVAGLCYQFLLCPIVPWCVQLFNATVAPLPPLDMQTLTALLFGMLGLGAMRSVEKVRGIS
jgi:hypothetical protein